MEKTEAKHVTHTESETPKSTGMPGWAKGCLIGCVVVIVLVVVVGGIGWWAFQTYVMTPERRELINQAVEVSQKVNPKDMEALSTFMEKLQSGEIKLTAEQQKQADELARAMESGTLDDKTIDQMLTLMASIDPATFGDTARWKETVKQVLPFFQNLMKEGEKIEAK